MVKKYECIDDILTDIDDVNYQADDIENHFRNHGIYGRKAQVSFNRIKEGLEELKMLVEQFTD